ncbi:hypothetical protein IW140_003534 [Coemansia sp. RSA 1813]|nr:hypothetical protein EV178_003377 [Coemansia sp. RSA 1646]KAJ1772949.1 hypothetical protein LPJ74_001090 [Coemansia sp. RSA 1843]KAJ2214342.1 hypothetical protein EV179_003124 [Coemansia sp. RSA 487]KAJ2568908.1 hypothetical protein IW140_003534 [Coemansia sp. RSA 1813]
MIARRLFASRTALAVLNKPTTTTATTRAVGRRFESTVKVGESSSESVRPPQQVARKKRPIGGFRGGVVGFLLGVTTAGAFGFIYLIEEYQKATSLVLCSVDELERSSLKVKEYVKKIEAVESDLEKVRANSATSQQVAQLKADWRKQSDILARDHLELKAHVWEIEQDVDSALGRSPSKPASSKSS